MERQKENQEHDADKNRNRRVFASQDFIRLHASFVLAALLRLDDRVFHQLFNEAVAHIGKRRVAVESPLLLHLQNRMLDQFFFVLVEPEHLFHRRIALDEPRCGKARADARCLRMVLNLMAHRVDAPVDRTRLAEIIHLRQNLPFRRAHRLVHQLRHAVCRRRADRDNRNAERLRHLLDVDAAAVSGQLVHHVECQHHRNAQRQQLQRQIEIALQIRRVDDVDDAVRLLPQNIIARHDLFCRIWTQGVNAGQVYHGAVFLPAHLPALLLDRYAGKIAHMLIGARELVEKRRLSAVLIARQCKNHSGTSSTVMLLASSLRSVRL